MGVQVFRCPGNPWIPRFEDCARQSGSQWTLDFSRGNESIYLHRSGPLLENGLDRPENRFVRYGFASFSSISIATAGLDGARASLWWFLFLLSRCSHFLVEGLWENFQDWNRGKTPPLSVNSLGWISSKNSGVSLAKSASNRLRSAYGSTNKLKSEWSFGKGMRPSRNQWRKAPFHWMGSRHSVNEGTGKEFYRKGNSLKRFRPFSESPDSKNWNLLRSSPSQITAPTNRVNLFLANKWFLGFPLFSQRSQCFYTLRQMCWQKTAIARKREENPEILTNW